jgi:DNA-binding NarL/FixJ family response regulator
MDDGASAPPLRVVIADDDRLFRDALEAVLSASAAIDVVGCAATGKEAVELASSLQPDVVLMDLNMPVLDGLEATRLIRERNALKVFILSGSEIPKDVARARSAGAAAFLRKDIRLIDLVTTILDARAA